MNGQSGIDYPAIVDAVPAIVFSADADIDAPWHFVSDWVEPILGFTVAEWLGTAGIWRRQLHPDDRDAVIEAETAEVVNVRQLLAQAQRAGTTAPLGDGSGTSHLDYRMLHKDGHVVWIRDSSVLVPGPDGALRWHGVMMDISDQKETERQLERQSAQQAAVARLGELALGGQPISELLGEACLMATEALGIAAAAASQLSDDGQHLEVRAACGWPEDERPEHHAIAPGGLVARTLQSGRPVLVQNWQQEDSLAPSAVLAAVGISSSIAARIEGPKRPWGVLGVFSRTADAFGQRDVNFVAAMASILSDAIKRQDSESAMQHRALHDPLTGLPNRVLFADRLEQALERLRRNQRSLAALLFIDVDHFKQVNDSLGHAAGDELLVGVATRLREAVRPMDTVARFGGDEFGLLLEEISSERVAIATAERIAAGFARPFVLEAGSQFVTASIGIALADGQQHAQALLADADASMYRAKQRGRARYDLFDDDLRMRALARGRTENELRRAIEYRELRLVYQPVVDLKDETVASVEALLRWDHPQRGVVLPSEFIPVAEESGMIERIGEWVLQEALRDLAQWEQLVPDRSPLRVGINISVQQLLNPRFPDTVSEAIESAGIDPQLIALELDESVLRDEADLIRGKLRVLKRCGVILAVDDYGTGDSSLRQLAALPIDTLKIDRSFVSALGTLDAAGPIAHAVIATGSALGLKVIGTGAETREQVEELRALGCAAAQGYYYSRPISPGKIGELLSSGGSLRRTPS